MMLWTIKLLPFQDTLTQHIFLICQRQCVKSFNTFQLRALKMRLRLCALYVLERLVCALCKCAWAVVKATYGGGWLVYGPDLLLNQIWPDTPNFPTFLDFQPFSSSKTHRLTYVYQASFRQPHCFSLSWSGQRSAHSVFGLVVFFLTRARPVRGPF